MLITVRTYPTISAAHLETVCTGAITIEGHWRRLYPVPLRYLDDHRQFTTYDVVSVDVRLANDGRPESRRPDMGSLKILRHVSEWRNRQDWIKPTIHASLQAMVNAGHTLSPVAAQRVIDIVAEPVSSDWSPKQKEQLKQELMFDERKPLEKVPYDFRVRWIDCAGVEHDSLVLAWEIYQTWRNFRSKYANPVEELRQKFLGDVFSPRRTVSLFMGNHSRFRDRWMVCGWYNPPTEIINEQSLF